MITTETFHTGSALRALRLINKARQCAKRGDVRGMYSYSEQAYLECKNAPPPPTGLAVRRVATFVANKLTYQVGTLVVIANRSQCGAFVRLTRYLKDDIHELICAMQGRTHGLWD